MPDAVYDKPLQRHHFLTDKNRKFTPRFKDITDKYGLNLDGDWNVELLPHQGRHPNDYHIWAFEQLENIDKLSNGNKQLFLNYFDIYIKQPIRDNPSMLYGNYWQQLK